MKNRPEELDALKEAIAEKAGFAIESKSDFEKLHTWLDKQLKEINEKHGMDEKGKPLIKDKTPSADTLMRIWGYTPYKGETSTKTLSLLARSIGYLGWEDFKSKMSETYSPHVPDIKEVFENQRKEILSLLEHGIPNSSGIYTLGWEPVKFSKLKHLGGFEFEVIESKNMHKIKGDTFITPDFKTCAIKDTELPDIKLDDYGDDYFETHAKEYGVPFTDDYFYL